MRVVNMAIESVITLVIALIAGAIGYGVLKQKVDSNKQLADDKFKNLQKQIDIISDELSTTRESLSDIKRDIAEIRIHVNYIVDAIKNK